MLSYEFCEISWNTFFTEHVWATASIFVLIKNIEKLNISENQQMRNPTITRIIHANKPTDNDFKTWTLCNKKSR